MFGRKAKVRKAIEKALASIVRDNDLADHAPIEALPEALRLTAYYTAALELVDDERYLAARDLVTRALEISPDEADLHKLAATIGHELGDVTAALEAQRRAHAGAPRNVSIALTLGAMLIRAEHLDEAVTLLRRFEDLGDREIDARLAEALYLRGESRDALAILQRVCTQYDAQLREPWSTTDRRGLIARAGDARRLRDDVYAELHGREATIDLAAAAGHLNARAGVNYRLMGARLAVASSRVAEVLELQDPDTTETRGRQAKTALAHALVGSAQLRRGELVEARKSFEHARELDGGCAAAFLGIGAVLDHEKYELHRRAERLALHRETPETPLVVPDWSVLTVLEKRVVWASISPFKAFLPRLAERGVQMRVLPIDVRATDIGLFEHIAGKRAGDDHRSYDALGGVATPRGAIAKIEELLDIYGDHPWVFAHEFAHLVYYHLDDDKAAPFVALFERAKKVGYANTQYALKNDDELFAVSYTEFLARRHGSRKEPIEDDAGIQQALGAYFAELCR